VPQLIIDGRPEGLPEAQQYYLTFPLEPSPLGDMTLTKSTTTAMTNSSVDAALDPMLKAGADGVVILVCHAYPQGILLPLATGGSALAVASNMKIVEDVITAEDEAASIRKMPAKDAVETKAVLDRWAKLLNRLQPGSITGTFTTKEAEAFYSKWLEMVAGPLGFSGKPRAVALRRFLDRLRKVRAIKLARLELRACNIGNNKETMEIVRKFFGALKLTAPTVGTFFLSPVLPSTVVRFRPKSARRILGTGRLPGPIGIRVRAETNSVGVIAGPKDNVTRGFLRTTVIAGPTPTLARSGMHLGTVEQSFFAFTLTIEETSAFHYKASATVVNAADGRQDWSTVREFVTGWILPNSSYARGAFPIAGLWTPDIQDLPFVLPNETSYTRLMEVVP
jgi:hypothetical protein